jgi:hypothetical protein
MRLIIGETPVGCGDGDECSSGGLLCDGLMLRNLEGGEAMLELVLGGGFFVGVEEGCAWGRGLTGDSNEALTDGPAVGEVVRRRPKAFALQEGVFE